MSTFRSIDPDRFYVAWNQGPLMATESLDEIGNTGDVVESVFMEKGGSPNALSGLSVLSGPDAPILTKATKESIVASTPTYFADRQRWELVGEADRIGDSGEATSFSPSEWAFIEVYQPDVTFDWYLEARRQDPRIAGLKTAKQVERWFQWQRMTFVGRSLIERIWGSSERWFSRSEEEEKPLEKAIVEFDIHAMGDRTAVDVLAQGIGMALPFDRDADIYFYDNILEYDGIAERLRRGIPADPNQPELLTDSELGRFFGAPDSNASWDSRAELESLIFGQE